MTVRVGVLGAARVTRYALVAPARRIPGIEVAAVAARDTRRAEAYAAKYGVPGIRNSYQDILDDPDIDAVYIPLPPSMHAEWTSKAITAGKHVLCEKPFTANAEEAAAVHEAAVGSGLVVMEAAHPSSHPQTARLQQIVQSGMLGTLQHARSTFIVPLPPGRDIRWNVDLGGGSLMDLGCYAFRVVADVIGTPQVTSARAKNRDGIDADITVRVTAGGIPVTVRVGMWSPRVFAMGFELVGSDATLKVTSPFQPHLFGRIKVDGPGIRLREKSDRRPSYDFQLEAFRDAITEGTPVKTGTVEALVTMTAIDAAHRAAGMNPR